MIDSKGEIKEHKSPIVLPDIDNRLSLLKQFETDLQNDEVSRARAAMRQIIEPRLGFFRKTAIVYHGSLQYNDPQNLDVDLTFVSDDVPHFVYRDIDRELKFAFTRPGAWPRTPCDTNFGFVNLSEIQEGASSMTANAYNYEEDEDCLADSASEILSSALLFESQRSLFIQYQNQIRPIVQQSQWLQKGVLFWLDKTISIRKERRNLPTENRL